MDVLLRCKIPLFLAIFFYEFSSGLLVIMSLEKLFVLHFPLHKSRFSTVKIAKRMSIGLAIFYTLMNSQVFYLYQLVDTPFGKVCGITSYEHHSIFLLVTSLIYSFIPLCIIGVSNMAIIYKFIKAKLSFKQGVTGSTNQALSKAGMKGRPSWSLCPWPFLF